jgi:hypothetical protein
VLFILVFLIDGWTRSGYSPVRHPVSALALGRRGWVQTTNFLLCGTAVVVGGTAVATEARDVPLGAVLVLFGLALVASGVFPMDPMRGYPPGAPEGDPAEPSARHRLHDVAGAVVFLALPAAAAVAVLTMPQTGWKIVSAVTAAGLMAGFAAFGRAWESGSPRTGLVQRAVIVPGWLWLAAVFVDFASR